MNAVHFRKEASFKNHLKARTQYLVIFLPSIQSTLRQVWSACGHYTRTLRTHQLFILRAACVAHYHTPKSIVLRDVSVTIRRLTAGPGLWQYGQLWVTVISFWWVLDSAYNLMSLQTLLWWPGRCEMKYVNVHFHHRNKKKMVLVTFYWRIWLYQGSK